LCCLAEAEQPGVTRAHARSSQAPDQPAVPQQQQQQKQKQQQQKRSGRVLVIE
jgi:hypothetical protein